MTGERVPFGPGPIVLGAAALFLTTLLLIGVLLPTDWEAEASTWIAAPPGAVFTYLDSPEGWQAWTPWPDSIKSPPTPSAIPKSKLGSPSMRWPTACRFQCPNSPTSPTNLSTSSICTVPKSRSAARTPTTA